MEIGKYTIDEYMEAIKNFHGNFAPGLLMGGFMIELAQKNLPYGEFFDVLCETGSCLPDAVQLLTPCTIGNGWLRIIDTGRFAITFFEKYTGKGIRVYLDSKKLDQWLEIKNWFFKLKPKHEQSKELLIKEMVDAGASIFNHEYVQVEESFLGKTRLGAIKNCSQCGEAYPEKHGEKCRACNGALPYIKK
jgi:formylmethanofuran dehydrogenase subunit E